MRDVEDFVDGLEGRVRKMDRRIGGRAVYGQARTCSKVNFVLGVMCLW